MPITAPRKHCGCKITSTSANIPFLMGHSSQISLCSEHSNANIRWLYTKLTDQYFIPWFISYLQETNMSLAKHISRVAPLPVSPNICSWTDTEIKQCLTRKYWLEPTIYMIMDWSTYEIIHMTLWTAVVDQSEEWSLQLIFQLIFLSNWKEEAWKKKSGLQRDSNLWPPQYRCDALPTELWNHTLTRDLCDTGAMLYQLSYEATRWERGQFVAQQIGLALNVWLHSSVGRASHRYRGGHGFKSRWSPDFVFRLLLSNCLNWKINCDDHS